VNIRIVTAWATTDCMACECLEKARSKISTIVVGLDFYTTSPSFLESFLSVIRIGKLWNVSFGKGKASRNQKRLNSLQRFFQRPTLGAAFSGHNSADGFLFRNRVQQTWPF
jgi:hypothetical protein